MRRSMNVAIDGPCGAGKSTIARVAAENLGFLYVDTGAMYRAIAVFAKRNGIGSDDKEKIVEFLPKIKIQLEYINKMQHIFLNGEDVSLEIRNHEISALTSDISSIKEVRQFLLELQRDIAKNHNIIMDGRDIGTVILPTAQLKIFLTASPEVRAKRRFLELHRKKSSVAYEKVLEDVKQRDFNDSTRQEAPLKKADDAVLLDTSDRNLDESINVVIQLVKERMKDVI